MKTLDLGQTQQRLLDIATVVDEICQKHDIQLFMIAGTMLGSIRHKGFIPWDDDMDFAVPYDRYNELINILREELPDNLKCITFDNSGTYYIPWIKVEDTQTYVLDRALDLPKESMPGLTIDIFPLASCDKDGCKNTIKKIQRLLTLQKVAYSKSAEGIFKNIVKRVIRFFTPYSNVTLSKKMVALMDTLKPGDWYTIPVDPCYYDRYFPKVWFEPKKYQFQDKEFYGPADFDYYLTTIYRDYMTLPPEEKRRVHCDNVFLR